jgi:hypothetical protein
MYNLVSVGVPVIYRYRFTGTDLPVNGKFFTTDLPVNGSRFTGKLVNFQRGKWQFLLLNYRLLKKPCNLGVKNTVFPWFKSGIFWGKSSPVLTSGNLGIR